MTFKRFFQLFIFYLLSILVPLILINYLVINNFWLEVIIFSVLGYSILTLPLTILTINKQKKATK